MAKKVLVSLSAWQALQRAIDAQPDQKTKGPGLFCTGGALERDDLETEYDWALRNAAHRIRNEGKL